MKREIMSTILHAIIVVSIIALATTVYDLFAFMRTVLVAGIPRTLDLTELLFQAWYFGGRVFEPALLPMLVIAVCLVGLAILDGKKTAV